MTLSVVVSWMKEREPHGGRQAKEQDETMRPLRGAKRRRGWKVPQGGALEALHGTPPHRDASLEGKADCQTPRCHCSRDGQLERVIFGKRLLQVDLNSKSR